VANYLPTDYVGWQFHTRSTSQWRASVRREYSRRDHVYQHESIHCSRCSLGMIFQIMLWVIVSIVYLVSGVCLAALIDLPRLMRECTYIGPIMFTICGPVVWFFFLAGMCVDKYVIQPKRDAEDRARARGIYDR